MKNLEIENLRFADKVASFSKDQSTKVGAAFFDEECISPIIYGYNGMPRGMPDSDPAKNERPEKYLWSEHAERNAIYNSAQSIMENSIIFCTHYPNMEGARAIVSSGIKYVIVNDFENIDKKSEELFNLTGIKVVEVSLNKSYSNKMHKKYQDYMDLAMTYGNIYSHDLVKTPSGVLVLNKKTFTPIASGASRPPSNIRLTDELLDPNSPTSIIQEPEKDAIFNAVRPKLKNSIAFVSWCPCSRCALAIATVGVKKVVTKKPDFSLEADKRWEPEFNKSIKIFSNLDIEIKTYDYNEVTPNPKFNMKPHK